MIFGLVFGGGIGLVVGAVGTFLLARILPDLLPRLPGVSGRLPRLPAPNGFVPVFDHVQPADPAAQLDPADGRLPDAVDREDKRIESIPHKDLRELVQILRTWKPRRHKDEDSFQRSFKSHLLKSGYPDEAIVRHPQVRWTAENRPPDNEERRAVPDFSVKKTVLVEIKRNITASSESDRALGQMARYCIAWRKEGPALLIVCNDHDANLRTFVERTVRGWKAQGIPVMAYFARGATVETGDDEFLPGTFRADA